MKLTKKERAFISAHPEVSAKVFSKIFFVKKKTIKKLQHGSNERVLS